MKHGKIIYKFHHKKIIIYHIHNFTLFTNHPILQYHIEMNTLIHYLYNLHMYKNDIYRNFIYMYLHVIYKRFSTKTCHIFTNMLKILCRIQTYLNEKVFFYQNLIVHLVSFNLHCITLHHIWKQNVHSF